MVFFNQVRAFEIAIAIARKGRARQHPVDIGTGSFCVKVLSPTVKGNAPRVGDAYLIDPFQLVALGFVAVKSSIGSSHRTIGSFHVGVKEHPFGHVDCPTFICSKGRDGMVGVVVIKSTEENFFAVCLIVSIFIDEQHQVISLRNIHSFGGNLKSNRNVQIVGKRGLLVCFAVIIGVFKNNQLVCRSFIPRLVVRIAWHGRHPESSFVVKGDLHGIGQVWKLFFGGE